MRLNHEGTKLTKKTEKRRRGPEGESATPSYRFRLGSSGPAWFAVRGSWWQFRPGRLDDNERLRQVDDNERQAVDRPIPPFMKHPLSLGRAEMEVLRFVADHAPVSVREVADRLGSARGHVRTTILNSMERLRQKGYLRRRKVEGVYQYSPVDGREGLFRRLLSGFVDAAFGGSNGPLVAFLSEPGRLSADEARELGEAVRRLDEPER